MHLSEDIPSKNPARVSYSGECEVSRCLFHAGVSFVQSSTLKMQSTGPSETPVDFHQNTQLFVTRILKYTRR
jgi:hypothetical protein